MKALIHALGVGFHRTKLLALCCSGTREAEFANAKSADYQYLPLSEVINFKSKKQLGFKELRFAFPGAYKDQFLHSR
jgi:hypothetical protein